MANDGKDLEDLVVFVERQLQPRGCEIKANRRVFNDQGIQIAELDIEVSGKFGSTQISWLIECRDRPSEGAAPASWIEQLCRRKQRFGFNRVTAVSTTGFAPTAVELANRVDYGIELRTVTELTADQMVDWINLDELQIIEHNADLKHCSLLIDPESTPSQLRLANEIREDKHNHNIPYLRLEQTGAVYTPAAIYSQLALEMKAFDSVGPNAGPQQFNPVVPNRDDFYFLIDTEGGAVRVRELHFQGLVQVIPRSHKPAAVSQYTNLGAKDPISEMARVDADYGDSKRVSLQFHRIEKSSEIRMAVKASHREKSDKAK